MENPYIENGWPSPEESARLEKRKNDALKITKDLFSQPDSLEKVKEGINLADVDVEIELRNYEQTLEIEGIGNDHGGVYNVWGTLIEMMRENPDLTPESLTDEEVRKKFLEGLPARIAADYKRRGHLIL